MALDPQTQAMLEAYQSQFGHGNHANTVGGGMANSAAQLAMAYMLRKRMQQNPNQTPGQPPPVPNMPITPNAPSAPTDNPLMAPPTAGLA